MFGALKDLVAGKAALPHCDKLFAHCGATQELRIDSANRIFVMFRSLVTASPSIASSTIQDLARWPPPSSLPAQEVSWSLRTSWP